MNATYRKSRIWVICFFLLVGVMKEAIAGTPAYIVKIDQAMSTNGAILSVSGSVTSSKALATAVTIDVLPPSGSPIRVITNLPLPAKQTSPYSWSGSLPNNATIPNGSNVRVTTNRQSSATTPIIVSVPVITQMSTQSAPTPPNGMTLSCFNNGSGTSAPSTTCPVVAYNGIAFWPFGYTDNRFSFVLVGYKNGQVVSKPQEFQGTRYIWQAVVDSAHQTVIFSGRYTAVSVPWASLK
jgi:hypothetical protein